MNKIVVNLGNFKLDEVPLGRGTLSIGRAPDNDISLSDSATSAYHAKIVTIFTSSFIQDLNSTNGTIVNGRKVVRHTLAHGDIISIGNLQLLFKSDAHGEAQANKPGSGIINKEKIQISKNKIAAVLDKETHALAKQPVQLPDKLKGFSISIPQAEELQEEVVEAHVEHANVAVKIKALPEKESERIVALQQSKASAIPVLDETLPLSELRRNPDRTVILNQSAPIPKAVEPVDSVTEKIPTIKPVKQQAVNDDMATADLSVEDDFDDNDIKRLLLESERQGYQSRLYAKYAIATTIILIIAAFTYILI